jgi:hypothetical protein
VIPANQGRLTLDLLCRGGSDSIEAVIASFSARFGTQAMLRQVPTTLTPPALSTRGTQGSRHGRPLRDQGPVICTAPARCSSKPMDGSPLADDDAT